MPSLLVQFNVFQVDIGFRKVVFFFLHVRISVWIDLGGGVPVIDLLKRLDSTPSECLSRSGNWAIPDIYKKIWSLRDIYYWTFFYCCVDYTII